MKRNRVEQLPVVLLISARHIQLRYFDLKQMSRFQRAESHQKSEFPSRNSEREKGKKKVTVLTSSIIRIYETSVWF